VRLLAQAQQAPAPVLPADTPYSKWVTQDVAYIIRDDERAVFKSLQSDPEREHFIEQFWQRRDPTPATVENEFKGEHYRRIAVANEQFGTGNLPGWKTDRGRIYIVYGPPDEKESHPSGGAYQRTPQEGGGTISTYPFEQWLYRRIEGLGTDIVVEFVDPTMTGEYRMTLDPSEKDVLHVNGDWPPASAATSKAASMMKVMFPKAFLSMRVLFKGAVQISLPLLAYGDHRVNVYMCVTSKESKVRPKLTPRSLLLRRVPTASKSSSRTRSPESSRPTPRGSASQSKPGLYCTLACRVTGASLPAWTTCKRLCVAFAASSSSR
jgi:GWxTD domain-containing protein